LPEKPGALNTTGVQTPLVMTIIGRDRPGLVEMVADLVARHGGNWLESKMSRLGGHFAGILRIHVPAENEKALTDALRQLAGHGLTVVAHTDTSAATTGETASALLEIVGQDRPGIVRQISRALALHGVNVEELQTECVSAPMSGETLFKAQARLFIPASCAVASLRKELEKIAQDLMADVSLEPLPAKKS
jgi:glycine cleavage system regulatory protein